MKPKDIMEGWDAPKTCTVCAGKTVRIDQHDAYACLDCDRWNEDLCSNSPSTCEYCVDRPEKPSMVEKK